jgi:hypothetical protein
MKKLEYQIFAAEQKLKKYIQINIEVSKKNENSISQKELDDFLDSFIEFVESKKMICGGGMTLKS